MTVMAFEGMVPRIPASVTLMPGSVVVGDVELGEGCSVWFNTVVRGDVNWIRIGNNTNIQDGAVLHVTNGAAPLRIGNGVTIGHLAMLHGCTVENHCLIGMHATVLDGAIIGEESLVAAGAVVLENTIVPPRSLVAGVPAKVRRSLSDEEVANLHRSEGNYIEYCRRFAADSAILPGRPTGEDD
ncbi:MAG: gamma carbonic anhydrase family protein [Calditrichaeota bacterium]|nr:gamma carbonic anhydrase family protein [Candidatus Cloacimonadota bacterium]MCB1046825.1 gamma carbonic anhydrase family protein [Calditrichota bacterium]MCB9473512.1 gamma carbonic anhydrase family protein [Candidatus Delongbacteria bacterium]